MLSITSKGADPLGRGVIPHLPHSPLLTLARTLLVNDSDKKRGTSRDSSRSHAVRDEGSWCLCLFGPPKPGRNHILQTYTLVDGLRVFRHRRREDASPGRRTPRWPVHPVSNSWVPTPPHAFYRRTPRSFCDPFTAETCNLTSRFQQSLRPLKQNFTFFFVPTCKIWNLSVF